eukprot:CAMPEP_0202774492 /NCGR_PEP_ID=MMETSP1388-20130828/46598_1 /ASSEMBLY_ACC=CAM_ASM_000864 /TAXON_ID=37098 /ORGANISM="Isochrysis sp, Strain CCMP1244" /LENGTH=93 /DNA_ID=CAMNT_0049443557 /DNA_START=39 /DNA_END=320 /DNA_ORIENTATION=-
MKLNSASAKSEGAQERTLVPRGLANVQRRIGHTNLVRRIAGECAVTVCEHECRDLWATSPGSWLSKQLHPKQGARVAKPIRLLWEHVVFCHVV